jgi:RHH-type proline utilization regulon transcriptional repressor/proline dehydrogenase/delta 1-pyrroline-5-carboxylate dehydrogenase
VHETIADHVIEMIPGAAKELVVGDPALLVTDVGPVIDGQAFDGIQSHITRLNSESKQQLGRCVCAQPFARALR